MSDYPLSVLCPEVVYIAQDPQTGQYHLTSEGNGTRVRICHPLLHDWRRAGESYLRMQHEMAKLKKHWDTHDQHELERPQESHAHHIPEHIVNGIVT